MAKARGSPGARREVVRPSAPYPGTIRIIGGRWRGRRLTVTNAPGLRPTPDRVRETVFNWLAPYLPGARCLDLFAGTGALCLEALSRGAGEATMVELAPEAVATLKHNLEKLRAVTAEVIPTDALSFLRGPARAFDIVFIDPPFGSPLIAACARELDRGKWVKRDGIIYLEAPSELTDLGLPATWELFRSKRTGQVGYHLARKTK